MFKNISKEEFNKCIQKSYVQTLNQMTHIRVNIGLNRELERYLHRLENKSTKDKGIARSLELNGLGTDFAPVRLDSLE